MMHVGDILSIMGVFSNMGDIMRIVGIVLSTMGDIMMHMGDIMSTMRVFSTVGKNLLLFEYPHGTEHPHGTHDIPTVLTIPHGTHDIPMVCKISSTFIMISPWY